MGVSRFVYDNFITNQNQIATSSVKGGLITDALKNGTGSAVITVSGIYTGEVDRKYTITIDEKGTGEIGNATFSWTNGDGTITVGVTTSTTAILLEDGVYIQWTQGTGDDVELDDFWNFIVKVPFGKGKMIDLNRDTRYKSNSLESPNIIEMNFGAGRIIKALSLIDHNLTNEATIRAFFDDGPGYVVNGFIDESIFAPFTAQSWNGDDGSISVEVGGGKFGDALAIEVDTGNVDLVVNGDFDSDAASWIGYDGSLSSVSGGQSGNCLRLLRVSGAAQSAGTAAGITVVRYFKYRCIVWVKIDEGEDNNFAIEICENVSGTLVYKSVPGIATTVWTKYIVDFEKLDTTSVYIHLVRDSGSSGDMFFDEVQLYEIENMWVSALQTITGLTVWGEYVLSFIVKSGSSGTDDFQARIGMYGLIGTTTDEWTEYRFPFKAAYFSEILHLTKNSGMEGKILFDGIKIHDLSEKSGDWDWGSTISELLPNPEFNDNDEFHHPSGWETVLSEEEGERVATYDSDNDVSDYLFMKQNSSASAPIQARASIPTVMNQYYTIEGILGYTDSSAAVSLFVGTTPGASDILNINDLTADTYRWGFKAQGVAVYITFQDDNAAGDYSRWDSIKIAEMSTTFENPSFDDSPFDNGWTINLAGGGGSVTQDTGDDYRLKFTQGGSSVDMSVSQAITTVVGNKYKVSAKIDQASGFYFNCKIVVSNSDSVIDPVDYDDQLLSFQFSVSDEEIIMEFIAEQTTTYVYIFDNQDALGTSTWQYIKVESVLVHELFDQNGLFNINISSDLITNPFLVFSANIEEDDCQNDNTGDWWLSPGASLAFDIDHYEFDPDDVDNYAIIGNQSVTEDEWYHVSVELKDGTGTPTDIKVYANDGATMHSTADINLTASWVVYDLVFQSDNTTASLCAVGIQCATNFSGNIEMRNFFFRDCDAPSFWTLENRDEDNYIVKHGTSGARIVSDNTSNLHITQQISVEPNTTYLLRIDKDDHISGKIRLELIFDYHDQQMFYTTFSGSDADSLYDFLFSTGDSTTTVEIKLYRDDIDDSDYVISHIRLYKTSFGFRIKHALYNTSRYFINNDSGIESIQSPINTISYIIFPVSTEAGEAYNVKFSFTMLSGASAMYVSIRNSIDGDPIKESENFGTTTREFQFIAEQEIQYIMIQNSQSSNDSFQMNYCIVKETSAKGWETYIDENVGTSWLVNEGLFGNCFKLESLTGDTLEPYITKVCSPSSAAEKTYRLRCLVKGGDINSSFTLVLTDQAGNLASISGTTTDEWVEYTVDYVSVYTTPHTLTFTKIYTTVGYIYVDQISIEELAAENMPWNADKILHFTFQTYVSRYVRIEITDSSNPDNYIEIGELFISDYFEPSKSLTHGHSHGQKLLNDTITTTYKVDKRKYRNLINELTGCKWTALTTTDKTSFKEMVDEITDRTLGVSTPVIFIPEIDKVSDFWLMNIIQVKFKIMKTPERLFIATITFKEEMRSV